jgi:C-terminal processing protease CtpA/Prc
MRTPICRLLLSGIAILSSVHALTLEQRIEDYKFFWQSFKEQYAFFDLKREKYGVDWDRIGEEYLAKVKTSKSDLELLQAITESQVALQDGHCYNGLIDHIYNTDELYMLPIDFKLGAGNKIFVNAVSIGSPLFYEYNISSGYELLAINGKTVRQIARERKKWTPASSPGQFWSQLASLIRFVHPFEEKPQETSASLLFLSPEGKRVEAKCDWKIVKAKKAPARPMDSLYKDEAADDNAAKIDSEGPIPMEVKIYPDSNTAYIKIETWMKTEDPKEQFEKVFSQIKDTDGLLLDLRNNGGGVAKWGILFANYLLDSEATVPNKTRIEAILSKTYIRRFPGVTEKDVQEAFSDPEQVQSLLKAVLKKEFSIEDIKNRMENGEFKPLAFVKLLNFEVNEVPTYTKPVVILMNGGCYSTTDIFMTLMKDNNRATFVGTTNGAGSGSPIPAKTPNLGFEFYVSHGKFFTPNEIMIEGQPIRPDILSAPSREDIVNSYDRVLQDGFQELTNLIDPFSNSFIGVDFNESPSELKSNTIEDTKPDFGLPKLPDYIAPAHFE